MMEMMDIMTWKPWNKINKNNDLLKSTQLEYYNVI